MKIEETKDLVYIIELPERTWRAAGHQLRLRVYGHGDTPPFISKEEVEAMQKALDTLEPRDF